MSRAGSEGPKRSASELARLTGLNVLATMTVPLASLVDTAMLGHLPVETALAGASLGALVFDYLSWGLGFLRMATTGLAAAATGREDSEGLRALLWRATIIGFCAGVVLLACRPVLLLGAETVLPGSPEVSAEAQGYIGARILGAPATLANFGLIGWLLGTGRSGRALVIASVANFANAGLNVWFIWVLGLGAAGAGYASACGQWLALIVVLLTMFRVAGPKPAWTSIFARGDLRQLFSLGGDITIRTICLVTAFSLFTAAGASWGSVVLAAQAVLIRVLGLFSYIVDGAAQAVETVAGRAFARGDLPGVQHALRFGYAVAVLASALIAAVLLIWPAPLLGLLTDIPPVFEHARTWLPWTLAVAFVGGFAYILDGLFIGIANGRALRNAMLMSFVFAFLPFLFAAVLGHSLVLLWVGLLAFMAARAGTLAFAWRKVRADVRS